MTRKLLLVEDEINLGSTLQEFLETQKYEVHWAKNVKEAKVLFDQVKPKIVLLDIGLPDGSGLDLAKQWRAERSDFVFLFLSALNDPDTKVEGLEIGAHDYITKPFALKELLLRLQRISDFDSGLEKFRDEISIGNLKIYFNRYEIVDAHGETIALSQKECAILKMLFESSPEVLDREKIIHQIWGDDKFPSNRTIDNYIVKLRKWCETDSTQKMMIQSVRGIGYKLIIKE
tara:strand:- start:147458 stop:148150 length:693 start_codon:yes stop_codon:yes gene_type:complete